jgi:xanthine/CO dehydrogenase XdhC/CoxF family maturation factor
VLGPAALDLPALTRVARGKILSCDDAWRTSVGSISGASAMHEHDEVLEQLKSWQDSGHRVAVATVVSTWGSSPRPVGSQLGVNDAGEMVGSVSGGCIEGAVVKEALEVMAGAAPRLLDYGVSNEQAWEVGLACGGKLEVYIEAVD